MNDAPALDAERAILGAALQDPIAADRMVEILVAADFLEPTHRKVFLAIAALVAEHAPIDFVTVRSHLPPEIGFAYLSQLTSEVIHGANASAHALTVKSASIIRQVEIAAQELRDECVSATPYPGRSDEIAQAFLDKLEALRERMPTRGYEKWSKVDNDFSAKVLNDEPSPDGLMTGFYDLDLGRGLLRDGEMIVLAARPSVGKSLFAQNVAEHLAISTEPVPVLFFSMEMSASAIVRRYKFAHAGVTPAEAYGGRLNAKQKAAWNSAEEALKYAPLYIHDEGTMTPHKIHMLARRFQAKYGKGLIVVDYLGLIQVDRSSLYERVTEASRCMKAMAMDLGCPVLVLAQLNRNFERQGPRDMGDKNRAMPSLADLRDSGAIEQDADVVIFLARNTLTKEPHPCDVLVAKNRPGRTGLAQVLFDTNGPRFRNLSKVEDFSRSKP